MKNRILSVLAIALFSITYSNGQAANAQYVKREQKQALPSDTSKEYASRVAANCLGGKWEEQPCLKSVSENNLVMAANYGAKLQKSNKNADAEKLKQHCAAATAASKGEYPAYAMRSAFVECANMIYDIKEASAISPDLSQYQILVGAVQCLDGSAACKVFEMGMQRYKR